MTTPDEHGLEARRQALVEAALRSDPALEEELELITARFDRRASREFWRAFADGCERHERPAAAVLVALERAALG